jgi:hypothetical protein
LTANPLAGWSSISGTRTTIVSSIYRETFFTMVKSLKFASNCPMLPRREISGSTMMAGFSVSTFQASGWFAPNEQDNIELVPASAAD